MEMRGPSGCGDVEMGMEVSVRLWGCGMRMRGSIRLRPAVGMRRCGDGEVGWGCRVRLRGCGDEGLRLALGMWGCRDEDAGWGMRGSVRL